MGNHFDEKAATWDDNPRRIKLVGEVWEVLQTQLDFSNIKRVLDYGCGTGLLGYQMAGLVQDLTFCDTSQAMLEQVEKKRAHHGYKHVETLRADFTKDALPDKHFDLIVSMLVLHHVEALDKLLAAFQQALSPEGIFAWIDLDEEDGSFHGHETEIPHLGFSKSKKESLLKQHGMEMIFYTNELRLFKEIEGQFKAFPLFVMLARKKDQKR